MNHCQEWRLFKVSKNVLRNVDSFLVGTLLSSLGTVDLGFEELLSSYMDSGQVWPKIIQVQSQF